MSSFSYVCPANYNPSDFVMHLSQTETMESVESTGLFKANDAAHDQLRLTLSSQSNVTSTSGQATEKFFSSAEEAAASTLCVASASEQIKWLTYREMLNIKRDTASLIGRFGVTIFLNILFGLIFLGAGGKSNADSNDFDSHFGAIAMVTIAGMFGAAQPVMLAFPFERPMFMREFSTGTCKLNYNIMVA